MNAKNHSSQVLLYLHIPKCGGSTITHVIYEQCRASHRDEFRNKYWHRGVFFYPAGLFSRPASPTNPDVTKVLSRHDLRAVVGHFAYGIHRHIPLQTVYATAVRHPVSRAISLYDELRRQKRIDMTLDEFIVNPPFPGMENDQTRRIAGNNASEKDDDSILEAAKSNLESRFAIAGVTERMAETLCLMHRIFAWKEPVVYYPKNVTLHRTHPDSLSPDLHQLIRDRNSLDLQLHEFAEKLLDEAIHQQGPGFQDEIAKYKQLVRDFVEQTKLDPLDAAERKRTHEIVLDMIARGKSR